MLFPRYQKIRRNLKKHAQISKTRRVSVQVVEGNEFILFEVAISLSFEVPVP